MNNNQDDLGALTSELITPLEKQIRALNLKAAGAAWGWFKRSLGTASEPFFRKEMGERYFGNENLGSGIALWILASLAVKVTAFLGPFASAGDFICRAAQLPRLELFFRIYPVVFLPGALLCLFYIIWGGESINSMEKYRTKGVAYHTMSRGTPRWGKKQSIVAAGIVGFLLLFNLPLGICFLAAIMMNQKLVEEQRAAIRSRYLDALDQEIEKQYMEKALLGEVPTEITYLAEPLPLRMDATLKSNIAAAAVGKPVKLMARSPVPKKHPAAVGEQP